MIAFVIWVPFAPTDRAAIRGHLGGVVAVDTDEAPIDLDADKGLVKGDAQTLGEIDNRVAAVRPDHH